VGYKEVGWTDDSGSNIGQNWIRGTLG